MTSNKARKSAIRAYMSEHPGVRYTEAAALLDQQRATTATATATAVADPPAPDDDDLTPPVAPRPDEVWPDPADPQAAAAAVAEVLWEPAAGDAACPCPGGCRHGQPCPAPDACGGRLRHVERLPSGDTGPGVDVHGWLDVHECAACGHETEDELRRETVPWGELLPYDGDLYPIPFPGVEHPEFGDPRHPDNAVLCTTCGWTMRMVCPECPGCGCYSHVCTGWRHEEFRGEDDDIDPDGCQCGPYDEDECQC